MTLKAITKALRKASGDPDVELVRGKGYFYFAGGIANHFYQAGVYGVPRLRGTTTAEWVKELQDRIASL